MPGIFRLYQRCVKEQLGKDTHVAAKIKTSLQRGGVSRVLGTGLASLAGVGLAGLYSTQRKSVQSPSTVLLGPGKQLVTADFSRLFAVLLFGCQEYFRTPALSPGQSGDANAAYLQSGYDICRGSHSLVSLISH